MSNTKELTDFQFFAEQIPNYFVTCSHSKGCEIWRCRSNTGMPDTGNEEKWNAFVKAVHNRWQMSFMEIDHKTCANHSDFSIYLSEFPTHGAI